MDEKSQNVSCMVWRTREVPMEYIKNGIQRKISGIKYIS